MRIFVTGATGFVGRALVRVLLEHHHEVMALSRNPKPGSAPVGTHWLQGDLAGVRRLSPAIGDFRPQALVHLAWEGIPDFSHEMCLKNFNGTLELFEVVADAGCPCVVSTGSCWEYDSPKGATRENAPLAVDKPFPAVKNAIRRIGEAMSRRQGYDFYWLRLFYVYGPGQRSGSLVPGIIRSICDNRWPRIQAPDNRNDFIHVDDAAEAIVSVIEKKPRNRIYNVGSGQSTAVKDVVAMVFQALNRPCDPRRLSQKQGTETQNFWADLTSLAADTGWSPAYSMTAGLESLTTQHGRAFR